MNREAYKRSWVSRLCRAVFWLITIPSWLMAVWMIIAMLVKGYSSDALVAYLICLFVPIVLFASHQLILWIVFGGKQQAQPIETSEKVEERL